MNTTSMTKEYILKPGLHQFAPGSHAVHDNDNLSDEEAKWYLEKYPHIAALFEKYPNPEGYRDGKPESPKDAEPTTNEIIRDEQTSEDTGSLNKSVIQ